MMNATNQQLTRRILESMERHLERRSWGVTTLLHLQEISPRDLGMAPEEKEEGRGKTKLLLGQTSETNEP